MAISKFSITKMKGENKISEENAMKDVLAACVQFDIDVDSEVDKKKKKNTEGMLNAILDFIMRGILEINTGTWEITHHLQGDYSASLKDLVYKPITGKQKLAMDGKDENDRYEMLYAVLGESCGLGESVVKQLMGVDLKAAETLTLFFL